MKEVGVEWWLIFVFLMPTIEYEHESWAWRAFFIFPPITVISHLSFLNNECSLQVKKIQSSSQIPLINPARYLSPTLVHV